MTDLDTLRPEVQEAMHRLENYLHITIDGKHFRSEDYDTIRAELLQLAKENAYLLSTIELDEQVWVQRDETMHRWIERARNAEAELAALKARIEAAEVFTCYAAIISGRDYDYISAILRHDDPAYQYPDLDGKRVQLLVEG